MGESISKFIKEKSKKEYRYAFAFAFILGLAIHAYKLLNYLPNHDSMYNFYADQNILGSGRWLLSIACGFSSYFDLPWVTGLLSLVFIALTSVAVVKLFNIKNGFVILLSAGILVAFPSTTEILCFGFTADGYFLSMLLAALAAVALTYIQKPVARILLSAALLCCSCGIYQAYVSFFLVLAICYFIGKVLGSAWTVSDCLKYMLYAAVSLVIALAAYYAIWKVCLACQDVAAVSYQGIDRVGSLNIGVLVKAVKTMLTSLVILLVEKNIFKHGISLYAVINCLFLAVGTATLITAVVRGRVFRSVARIAMIVLSLIAIPFAVFIWLYTSPDVLYALRMEHSAAIVFIGIVVLCDKTFSPRTSTILSTLPILMIFNLAVQANIAYYYLNFEYERSYYEAHEILNEIEDIAYRDPQHQTYKVAIIGSRHKEAALDDTEATNTAFMYTQMIEKSLLLDGTHARNFLENVLYCDLNFANAQETADIEASEEFREMPTWPCKGSVRLIDDVITVRFGEEN